MANDSGYIQDWIGDQALTAANLPDASTGVIGTLAVVGSKDIYIIDSTNKWVKAISDQANALVVNSMTQAKAIDFSAYVKPLQIVVDTGQQYSLFEFTTAKKFVGGDTIVEFSVTGGYLVNTNTNLGQISSLLATELAVQNSNGFLDGKLFTDSTDKKLKYFEGLDILTFGINKFFDLNDVELVNPKDGDVLELLDNTVVNKSLPSILVDNTQVFTGVQQPFGGNPGQSYPIIFNDDTQETGVAIVSYPVSTEITSLTSLVDGIVDLFFTCDVTASANTSFLVRLIRGGAAEHIHEKVIEIAGNSNISFNFNYPGLLLKKADTFFLTHSAQAGAGPGSHITNLSLVLEHNALAAPAQVDLRNDSDFSTEPPVFQGSFSSMFSTYYWTRTIDAPVIGTLYDLFPWSSHLRACKITGYVFIDGHSFPIDVRIGRVHLEYIYLYSALGKFGTLEYTSISPNVILLRVGGRDRMTFGVNNRGNPTSFGFSLAGAGAEMVKINLKLERF